MSICPSCQGLNFCILHFATKFQITTDKPILIPKVDCYKGKEILIEDDEYTPSTHYVKTRLSRLFKHEVAALQQKRDLTSKDWLALKRYYKLGAHCSSLESKEKPPLDGVHHKTEHCYQTTSHNLFEVDSPSKHVCVRKREFIVVFERSFSFSIDLTNSIKFGCVQVKLDCTKSLSP